MAEQRINYPSIILWGVASLIFLFSSCSSDSSKYEAINEDYCSLIEIDTVIRLSDNLTPIAALTASKTGVYTLEEGDLAMIFRAWLTESAEKTIDIQYFIFSGDNIGLIAIDYLLKATDRGIKVRLFVDDIMIQADADELLALDSHPNLSIKIYNPTTNIGKNLPEKLYALLTDFRGFNQRMHNKTFIVDNQAVITGGRNMADEYFDYDHEYNFRDRDVLLVGKVTSKIVSSFSLFWDSNLSVPISDIVQVDKSQINAKAKFEYLHQYACNPANFWPEVREKIKSVPLLFQNLYESGDMVWVDQVNFVSDLPGKNTGDNGLSGGRLSTDSLISLIKKSIYI
jgi:cardiolipin synthase C